MTDGGGGEGGVLFASTPLRLSTTSKVPEAVDDDAVLVLLALEVVLVLTVDTLLMVSVAAVSSAILSATTLPAVFRPWAPMSWLESLVAMTVVAGVTVPSLATITLTVVSVSSSKLLPSSMLETWWWWWCWWCDEELSMRTDLAASVSITDSVSARVDSSSMSMSCLMSMMIWWCLVPDAPDDVCTCTCVSGTWWWRWWVSDKSRPSLWLASLNACTTMAAAVH